MTYLWLTRGRHWGFRFLRDANLADPLPVYEAVFAHVGEDREVCVDVGGDTGLRFLDPVGRRDAAGRVIPHEFVIFAPLSQQVNSVSDGLRIIWPEIADEFARLWEEPSATTPH